MNRLRAVNDMARRMPRRLRQLRGKLMIEHVCENFGVEETQCPACEASGWLDRRSFVHCPICCGFREVPTQLAVWVRDELRRGGGRRLRRVGRVVPSDARGSAPLDRHGRMAELPYRAHLGHGT